MTSQADPPTPEERESDGGFARIGQAARVTPMMAQYLEIKAANPDCLLFYRMGDFYELFFGDAEVASRTLGIVLTKRGRHEGEDIRMCGVPIERADDYLQRLIAHGHRVAVCEQLEDPSEARKRGDQIGGASRCRAPGDARHNHRGPPAGAGSRQYSHGCAAGEVGGDARDIWPRRGGHFDRRLLAQRDRRGGPRRRDRAHRAERNPGAPGFAR